MPEGNTGGRVMASGHRSPGVEGPFACHTMTARQPVRSTEFLASRDTPLTDAPSMPNKPHKQERQTTRWKSDDRIVPLKRADQACGSKPGNAGAGKAVRPSRDSSDSPPTPSGGSSVLDRLDRITQRAESHPEGEFNNLFSLLTYELLWYAFWKLKRDKAPGVDGVTVDQYEEQLRENLQDLLPRCFRSDWPDTRWSLPRKRRNCYGLAALPDVNASVWARGRRGRSISLVLLITAARAARNGSS